VSVKASKNNKAQQLSTSSVQQVQYQSLKNNKFQQSSTGFWIWFGTRGSTRQSSWKSFRFSIEIFQAVEVCWSLRFSPTQNRLQYPPGTPLSIPQVVQFETFVSHTYPVDPLVLHQELYLEMAHFNRWEENHRNRDFKDGGTAILGRAAASDSGCDYLALRMCTAVSKPLAGLLYNPLFLKTSNKFRLSPPNDLGLALFFPVEKFPWKVFAIFAIRHVETFYSQLFLKLPRRRVLPFGTVFSVVFVKEKLAGTFQSTTMSFTGDVTFRASWRY